MMESVFDNDSEPRYFTQEMPAPNIIKRAQAQANNYNFMLVRIVHEAVWFNVVKRAEPTTVYSLVAERGEDGVYRPVACSCHYARFQGVPCKHSAAWGLQAGVIVVEPTAPVKATRDRRRKTVGEVEQWVGL